jgi:hypothetical protein
MPQHDHSSCDTMNHVRLERSTAHGKAGSDVCARFSSAKLPTPTLTLSNMALGQSVAALDHMTSKARCAHDEGDMMRRVGDQLAHLLRDTPGGAVQPAEGGRERIGHCQCLSCEC